MHQSIARYSRISCWLPPKEAKYKFVESVGRVKGVERNHPRTLHILNDVQASMSLGESKYFAAFVHEVLKP